MGLRRHNGALSHGDSGSYDNTAVAVAFQPRLGSSGHSEQGSEKSSKGALLVEAPSTVGWEQKAGGAYVKQGGMGTRGNHSRDQSSGGATPPVTSCANDLDL